MSPTPSVHPAVDDVEVGCFRIPTDRPESDGTLAWDATTLVVVELRAGGERGLGYTYASAAVAHLIRESLEEMAVGADPLQVGNLRRRLFAALRNQGDRGLVACAVSAIDTAAWDLKARLLGLPLVDLLGAVRDGLPVYGSGGFTSYSDAHLEQQFTDWAHLGIHDFKMKIGRDPAADVQRVRHARRVIGPDAGLFVDGNGAYTPREAIATAATLAAEAGICWLEQPLPPDDLEGLRFVREHLGPEVELADGEYGYVATDFRRLLDHQAVDVVMADATRCGGVTGFLEVATLCEAWHRPLSSHCAPALHRHLGCAAAPMRHAEYFHDHARIEALLFDGAAAPRDGVLTPDRTRPGLGLDFKWSDAAPYAV